MNVIKYQNKQKEWHTATKPLRIPPVQESSSTRVKNKGGKQDLIRSPQEDNVQMFGGMMALFLFI
jgi:hypothetical protein